MVGVALFLLLSFRNNAAFNRWQVGSDRFKNFCNLAKSVSRLIAGTLQSFVETGGQDVAYDLVLEKIHWLMVAVEAGRQHLRGEPDDSAFVGLISDEEIEALARDRDPVLFSIFNVLQLDRKYYAQKCVEWIKVCDVMYMEFCACVNVYTTPIPFAVSR